MISEKSIEARRLYQSGLSSDEVGTRMGMATPTVIWHLHRAKTKMRPKGGHNAKQVDVMALRLILQEAKMGIEETAKHFGVSVPTISRTMRRHGLKSKKGHGSPMEKNFFWNGGRKKDRDHYVLVKVPGHPNATKQGYVREHRLVMENMLGRYLDPIEVVHHQDSDKTNNDPSNLILFANNAEHLLYEWKQNPRFSDPRVIEKLPLNVRRIALAQLSSSRPSTESDDCASQ